MGGKRKFYFILFIQAPRMNDDCLGHWHPANGEGGGKRVENHTRGLFESGLAVEYSILILCWQELNRDR